MFSVASFSQELNHPPQLVFFADRESEVAALSTVLGAYLEQTKTEDRAAVAVGRMVVSAVDFLAQKNPKRGGAKLPPIMFTQKEGAFINKAFNEVLESGLPAMPTDGIAIAAVMKLNLQQLDLAGTSWHAA